MVMHGKQKLVNETKFCSKTKKRIYIDIYKCLKYLPI